MKRLQVGLFVCSVVALPWLSGTSFAQAATDLVCTQCVGSSDIANDSVGSAKIKEGTIASNDIAANGVKTANINNGAVTFNKLATGIRQQLDEAIAQIVFERVGTVAVSSATAVCDSDKFPVSAGCGCSTNGGANNFGLLAYCIAEGDAAFGGCSPNPATYDPQLPLPIIEVVATCMGATSADGTPWLPTPAGLVKSDGRNVNEPFWRKEQQEIREAAVAKYKEEAEALLKAMRQQ